MQEALLAPLVSLLPSSGRRETEDDREQTEPHAESVPGRTAVLIVEDESLVALDIERIVSEAGYHVLGVVDTEQDAVEEAARLKPDVVLMDIRLREGNGIAAAKAIQAKRDVPVIFISANLDPETVTRIAAMKHAAIMRKPFADHQLTGQLQRLLARRT